MSPLARRLLAWLEDFGIDHYPDSAELARLTNTTVAQTETELDILIAQDRVCAFPAHNRPGVTSYQITLQGALALHP